LDNCKQSCKFDFTSIFYWLMYSGRNQDHSLACHTLKQIIAKLWSYLNRTFW
jgi:hypothetical protein